MTAPSREAQVLIDKLVEVAKLIESHEAVVWQLRHEQLRLRSALAATGYRPDAQQELL